MKDLIKADKVQVRSSKPKKCCVWCLGSRGLPWGMSTEFFFYPMKYMYSIYIHYTILQLSEEIKDISSVYLGIITNNYLDQEKYQ